MVDFGGEDDDDEMTDHNEFTFQSVLGEKQVFFLSTKFRDAHFLKLLKFSLKNPKKNPHN